MTGLEISKKPTSVWLGISISAIFLSVGLCIGVGPVGVYIASGCGLVFAFVSIFQSRSRNIPISAAPVVSICVHVCLLLIAFVLQSLFLSHLSDRSLTFPRLSQHYRDPAGIFELRVPTGWAVEGIHSPTEAGVRLHPSDRSQYMGVSELTVRVRELENIPKKPSQYLEEMVKTFSSASKKQKRLFQFSTRPAKLMSGGHGIWSNLVLKRFWVPLYQTALFGIKEKRYLCSVSASGLKNHSTLAEVLCLGVFETIRIPSKKP